RHLAFYLGLHVCVRGTEIHPWMHFSSLLPVFYCFPIAEITSMAMGLRKDQREEPLEQELSS
ncbi:hypothetical protein ACOALZ_04595, partial [Nocardiopsis algeriensis]|uniref:hypothetical protein n=1 Tax=Nocardiopsis algeriensis TaxID=1478215 RepID=UPI003B42B292